MIRVKSIALLLTGVLVFLGCITNEPQKYQLTVLNSYAETTGAGLYYAGDSVTVYAGMRSEDYTFGDWKVAGSGVIFGSANPHTFTMPESNVTLAATWESMVSYTITSPYAGVNWNTDGQYKASLHVHTNRSDGDNTLSQMVEEYYSLGFDILAITDHNVVNVDWVSSAPVNSGTDVPLTSARYTQISSGSDRGGRKMLMIPNSNENSRNEHVNSYLVNFNNASGNSWSNAINSISQVQTRGGISRINHPGRYTGAHPAHGFLGLTASNNATTIKKYVDVLLDYDSCTGIEIINKKDGESASDRILWDNILKQSIPQGVNVWAFSDDDSHNAIDAGYSYNVFIMPENTLENFRSTFINGNFYAVALVAKREGVNNTDNRTAPVPVINSISVNNDASSITITAQHHTRIDWIYDNKVITSGNTITLTDHNGKIGCYVRANVIGADGIAFTQAFVVEKDS